MFVAGLSVVILLVGPAAGQSRKKRAAKQPATAVISIPQQSEPEIVSRADDYRDPIIEPQVPQKSDPEPSQDRSTNRQLSELGARIKNLESSQSNDYDQKQKRLLLNLDILTRAEQRSESLRKQRFDLIEKESGIRTKLEQIENDLRPEMIERTTSMMGSLRPEEIRDARRKNLEAERRNQQDLLTEIQSVRGKLELSVQKADDLVERLRAKLEKDIDAALADTDDEQPK
jgi:hypothetical protein